MLTTRELPAEEWPKLAGTLLEQAWPQFEPGSRVFVVERDGQIVRCGALVRAWHLEGIWAAPRERGVVSSARAFVTLLRHVLAEMHIREVLSMTLTSVGVKLCQHFGHATELRCQHFVMTSRGASWESKA